MAAGGCVFEGIATVLNIRRYVGYNTQWAHLKYARDNMNATYPQLGLPEKIPGFSRDSLLTRCYYGDVCEKKGKNRRRAAPGTAPITLANMRLRWAPRWGTQPAGREPDGILDDGIVD
ncbi:hypothetical protein AB0M50_35465 [Nonomuraea fuscirosea]|uniref:hypothetical protein n=1 Tax=Nonomuraea fuscirosea TaxID=1291556 RepID=UPI00342EB238